MIPSVFGGRTAADTVDLDRACEQRPAPDAERVAMMRLTHKCDGKLALPDEASMLRARCERPRRRAAQEPDELAAPCMSGKQHSEE
jgi:hypothetical protein